ncbi:MAG: MoxR family ATPase [Burkholderiales bacterium]|nr:MoxR family ATPase [Pseudomonadota bacterium]
MNRNDALLQDWRTRALALEAEIKKAVIGQDRVIHHLNIAVFARGHVLLEGDVGVGKTTVLRAFARAIGGAFERVEGTVDLMPNDLIYYTYINEEGKPRVDPGPLLKHGDALSIFFFNEINRARPQVHSLLLRVMAEHSASAFNREYRFPHMIVFADRNRVEKDETFEISAAARDRFSMEVLIETPTDIVTKKALMFDTAYHDVEHLLERVAPDMIPYIELNGIGATIQDSIKASETLQKYAMDLWQATRTPTDYGVNISGVNMKELIQAGASPRGMSLLMRAARVKAWLEGREYLTPEDLQAIYHETMAHRVFFSPIYEMRRGDVARALMGQILQKIAAP